MAVRRRYRYEKDILGRKHQKYFLENVFAADISDMKTFRALRSKLSRDYLGFFKGLGKLYEKGEFKQVADESVSSINRTINLIDSIVESGVFDKKDVDTIIKNVSEVNIRKDILVEKSEQVKAVKGKLVSIEKTTGVRPEDLNVTKKLIQYGAGREAKKGREGVLPFLQKTMPKTFGLAGEIAGGIGTAALGPFAPVAKAVGGFAGDIFGLGRGIAEKFGERKERRMGRRLTPMSMGMSEEALGRIRYRRGYGETVAGVGGSSRKKAGTDVLMDFFSRGAYKAKWTKELLKKMKGLFSKGKKGAEISGIAGMISSFGAALGGLIGPAGKLALLGGAAYLATDRLKTLGEKSFEYLDVLKNVSSSTKRLSELETKAFDRLQVALGEKIGAARKSGDPVQAQAMTGLARSFWQERAKDTVKKSGWVDAWKSGAQSLIERPSKSFLFGGGRKPFTSESAAEAGITSPGEKLRELSQMQKNIAGQIAAPKSEELLTAIRKLDESVLGLSKEVGKSNVSSPIGEPGIGNMFDGGDPLTRDLSEVNLEIGM